MEIQWKPWLLWQPQGPTDLQWKSACHHHNFSDPDQMLLKLGDDVGMDEILDKVKNWPDWVINLSLA